MAKERTPKQKKQEEVNAAVSGAGVAPVSAAPVEALAEYGWAQNVVKLNRAVAWVAQNSAGLKGKALEEAVKERYILMGGALKGGEKPNAPRAQKEVNLAEDDGSADDADDEDDN